MNTVVALPIAAALPVAAPAMTSIDRRATEAYASWLLMERRILCGELWPDDGAKAERYDWHDNAGAGWHFDGRGDLAWNEGPQPSSRAAAVLDLAGVDWRQPKRDYGLNHEDTGARPPLPARWPELDGELTNAYDEILALDEKIAAIIGQLGTDDEVEDCPEYLAAEEARLEAIGKLSETESRSWEGVKAKASALKLRTVLEDHERTAAIAESLADDILQLAKMAGPNAAG